MLDINQFKNYVVRPALKAIKLYSEPAEELIIGTALQESDLTYLVQLDSGPAQGVFQMEPKTHDDIWLNFLSYRNELAMDVACLAVTAGFIRNETGEITVQPPHSGEMVWNLQYAAAMARLQYYRRPEILPKKGDVSGQAEYWKEFYNTIEGAGTVEEYEEKWFSHHPDPDSLLR